MMPKITLTFSFGCSFAEASILAKSKLSRPLKCLANFSTRLLVVSHVVHHGVNTCFKTVMGFNMGMQSLSLCGKTVKPLDQLTSSLSSFFSVFWKIKGRAWVVVMYSIFQKCSQYYHIFRSGLLQRTLYFLV